MVSIYLAEPRDAAPTPQVVVHISPDRTTRVVGRGERKGARMKEEEKGEEEAGQKEIINMTNTNEGKYNHNDLLSLWLL